MTSSTAADFPDVFAAAGVAQQDFPAAVYVVATPLGNAADMTLRALWVLRLADAIAAEDTRTTAPLLARFGIARPLVPLHQHNEAGMAAKLLDRVRAGERIALVSDAGTPAISDPGARLVAAALAAGLRVLPVPGPSSMAAALSVAGVRTTEIRFAGFAPAAAQARRRHWESIAQWPGATVLFEAPHRMADTARELGAVLEPARRVVVGRELTKKFESVQVFAAGELAAHFAAQPPRGEFVVIVDAPEPAAVERDADGQAAIDAVTLRWLQALAPELAPARAAAVAAAASGLPRALLYRTIERLRAG